MRRTPAAALPALLVVLAARPAAAASEGGDATFQLIWQAVNLAILVGVLVFFGRKPVREYLASRREGIRTDLESSAQLLADAEARLAEWQERTGRLEAELADLRESSRRLAEEERAEILAQAQAMAERIRSDAAAAVDQEVRRARQELTAEAAELAVELAGRMLREKVGPQDQARLFDEFLERVGADGSREAR